MATKPIPTMLRASLALTVALVLGTAACGASGRDDNGEVSVQAATAGDGGSSTDGTPTRQPCTSQFGSGLAGTFGRLDGTIVAVVPHGRGSCNADRSHVHVQVLSSGSVYDVAVNTDGGFYAEISHALPGEPWRDGWHRGGSLDYRSDLGLHSNDFNTANNAQLERVLLNALADANHVSVFASLYSHGGVHLVHRARSGQPVDGALVLDPLAPSARVFAFHFSDQRF